MALSEFITSKSDQWPLNLVLSSSCDVLMHGHE